MALVREWRCDYVEPDDFSRAAPKPIATRARSDQLARRGFSVTHAANQTLAQLRETLRSFREKTQRADVALVYFAGHGIELGGSNYLLPADARLTHSHANPEHVRHIFRRGVCIGQILNLRPRPEAPAGDWCWSMPLGLLVMLEPYQQTGRAPKLEEAIADARQAWGIIEPVLGEDVWWWLVGEAVERARTAEYPRLIVDADVIELLEEHRHTHGMLTRAPATIGSELDRLMKESGPGNS